MAKNPHAAVAASITVFVILMAEYFLRFSYDRPVREVKKPTDTEPFVEKRPPLAMRMQLMNFCIVLMTIFLVLR